eukprot:gene10301-11364_t
MAADRATDLISEEDKPSKAKKPSMDGKKKVFRWTDEMHALLIECLADYKVTCEFNNVDFDADKIAQYRALRIKMAERFNQSSNEELPFGPVNVAPQRSGEYTEEEIKEYNKNMKQEQKQITTGYNRVQEKVKLIRQGFSKAIIAGTRSGSGKLICEHYDTLKNIWGGSPNSKPLSTGIHSSGINDQSICSEFGDSIPLESTIQDEDSSGKSFSVASDSTSVVNEQDCPDVSSNGTSVIPKLIDNKRKHLQRRLSAAQRDSILMEESKDDKIFRQQLTETLKESSQSMAKAMNSISQSMMHVSNAIAQNMQMMAQSFAMPQNSHPYNYQSFSEQNHYRRPMQKISREKNQGYDSYLDMLNE